MNTEPNTAPQINSIIEQMVVAGTPRPQAVALGMAIEHALACPHYKTQFGTYLVAELQAFVDKVA